MSEISLAKIENATATDRIARRVDALAGFDKSLMSIRALAVLTELVVEFQPEFILEIGTYFGGGSEILARALNETSSGLLITLDSNEARAEEVERRMALWDPEVQAKTTFLPHTSEEFFRSLIGKWDPAIDIAIVDGEHTYLGAYGDIVRCAQQIAGGGMIIVDDYDQSTVNRAVADFIQTHPDWRLVGDVEQSFVGRHQYAPRPSIKDTPFFILLAPDHRSFSRHPMTIDYSDSSFSSLSGAELATAPHNCQGTLHGEFSIEISDDRGMVQANTGIVSVEITPGQSSVRLELDNALESLDQRIVRCIANYTWIGEDDSSHLPLVDQPKLIVRS